MNEENERYQKIAKDFLENSPLISVLEKYGEVIVAGSYKANLMMCGDIDIYVIREATYEKSDVLDIFSNLYKSTNFRSYFIHGDWNDVRKGNEFPDGHYIGAKFDKEGEKWEIDIWFISKNEYLKRQQGFLDVAKLSITDEQRTTILDIKKYRKENKLEISSQKIYEAVINQNIKTLDEYLRMIASK